MLTEELVRRQTEAIEKKGAGDLWVFSNGLVNQLQLTRFAHEVLSWAESGRRALPAGLGGRPQSYSDATILVTLLVMTVWQLSPETMVKRMKRWDELALACGYVPGQVISASQLRRRRERLGLWVYFVTLCLLVFTLIQKGVITGRDWVIDSTTIDAFSRQDGEAGWSFTGRFGYKVHMLICRDSLLPIVFLVSPANANDGPWAPRLMAMAHALFNLPVQVVRADAAYYTKAVLAFIVEVLGATPKVVFNPRRTGKTALVTLQWVAEFRTDKGKRGYIERLFAVLKRYYRLNNLSCSSLWHAYRHAFEICFAVLLTAWLAHDLGRPDLAHARSRLLAPC